MNCKFFLKTMQLLIIIVLRYFSARCFRGFNEYAQILLAFSEW